MQNGLFKIIAFLLFLFSGHFAAGSNFLHNNREEAPNKAAFIKESLNKNPYNPYNYECIISNAPVQLNIPQHRNVHFSQVLNSSPNTCHITVTYLNLICGRGNGELSRFRKLILFPFHAFW